MDIIDILMALAPPELIIGIIVLPVWAVSALIRGIWKVFRNIMVLIAK